MINGLRKGGNFLMLKKMLPLLLVLGLVLGACGTNNDAVPNQNETPMENNNNIDRKEKNWTPNVNDDGTGGTNVDGLDNGTNGTDDGVINNDMFENNETENDNMTGNDDSLNNR